MRCQPGLRRRSRARRRRYSFFVVMPPKWRCLLDLILVVMTTKSVGGDACAISNVSDRSFSVVLFSFIFEGAYDVAYGEPLRSRSRVIRRAIATCARGIPRRRRCRRLLRGFVDFLCEGHSCVFSSFFRGAAVVLATMLPNT